MQSFPARFHIGRQAGALFLSLCLIFTSSHSLVFANPTGSNVVYGDAFITARDGLLEIQQGGNQLIIDWQEFSIDAGETTRFIQPSIDAAVLNRVISSNLSEIHGQLIANGQVYLINPNGIIFGENARVDAGSFTASTLDVENADFLDGDSLTFRLSGMASGEIVNMGRLESISGDVTLISEVIYNDGDLIATHGSVNLAAGREVIVQPDADQRILISLPSDRAFIENSGTIEAARAEIVAANSNPYSSAINQKGIVRATGTEEVDGEIWLVANEGTVDIAGLMSAQQTAASGAGGDIFASGSRIAVQETARLLAEGDNADGGRIRIGGSRRGEDASVFHADRTHIADGAEISANATGVGNTAGTIIAWGNETLRSYGQLSARGDQGAHGGFIETSAGWFDLGQSVPDVGSDFGQGGEWLIDPYNIVINGNGVDEFDDTGSPFDNPNANSAELDVDTILAALSSGSGVTVTVETNGAGSQPGDITVETDLDFNGIGTGDTLWLIADDDIFLNANVNISDTVGSDDSLSVVLQSDSDGSGAGRIDLATGSSIETNGGEIIMSGGNYSTLADLRNTGYAVASSTAFGVNIDGATLSSGAGDITLRGTEGTTAGVRLANTFNVSSTTGDITIDGIGSTTDTNAVGVFLNAGGSITSAGGDVLITGVGNSDNSGVTSAYGIQFATGSAVTVTGDSTLTLNGTGSQEANDTISRGLQLNGSTLSVENGDMTITGVGG